MVEKALDADEIDGGYSREALPTEADFVLAYATVPGYIMIRYMNYPSLLSLSLSLDMYHGVTLSMGHGLLKHLLIL